MASSSSIWRAADQSPAVPLVLLTNDGVLAGYGEVVKVVSMRTIDTAVRRLSDSAA